MVVDLVNAEIDSWYKWLWGVQFWRRYPLPKFPWLRDHCRWGNRKSGRLRKAAVVMCSESMNSLRWWLSHKTPNTASMGFWERIFSCVSGWLPTWVQHTPGFMPVLKSCFCLKNKRCEINYSYLSLYILHLNCFVTMDIVLDITVY